MPHLRKLCCAVGVGVVSLSFIEWPKQRRGNAHKSKGRNMKQHNTISIQDYHNNKDIPSRSTLLQALKSPAHLRKYLDGRIKKTDNMKLGTFIHDFLENNMSLAEHWTAQQEVYLRATNGRPAGSPKLDDEGRPLFSYVNTANADDSLTPAKSVLARAMMTAIENDVFITNAMGLPDVVIEPTFVGDIDGYKVKARPDIAFTESNTLVEIKTISSLDPGDIAREFFEYGYDMQAYLELELSGADMVYFFLVSSEDPSGTARVVITRDSVWYNLGKNRVKEALRLFYANKDLQQTSYTKGEITLPLPYKAVNYMAENGIEE